LPPGPGRPSLAEMSLGPARRVFSSLSGRNYRLWFAGQLVSLSGTWMQQVAQDWLVLQLTGRAFPVGVTTALQFAPVALFGVWGGLVADRVDRRRLVIACQAAAGLLALALGLLTLTGVVELWMVYLLAFALGVVTAFDLPARQAFVIEMVGPDRVANAVGLNAALFNSARVIGPALAGAAILAFGLAPAFLLNAVSYLAPMAALVAMDPARLHRQAPAPRARGQVREGLRYVWSTPVLRSTLLLVAVVGTLGLNYKVVLPVLARFEFAGGPDTYGLMLSVMSAGSVAGALIAAGRQRPTRALLLGAAGAFGLLSLASAAAPTLGWELVVLVPVGAAMITFLSTANALLQLNSDPAMRGRVMALYGVVFLGTAPIGGALAGWLAEILGARAPLWLAGLSSLAAALAGRAAGLHGLHDNEADLAGRGLGAVASEAVEPAAGPSRM
jgi:MFS family permease